MSTEQYLLPCLVAFLQSLLAVLNLWFLILLVSKVFLNAPAMKVLEAKATDISDSCTTAYHSQL